MGGGFILTIYINGEASTLNAREVAPKSALSEMFVNKTHESLRGGKAVAVPGELKGLWELKQKYGNKSIKWSQLIEPNIKLAREGHVVTPYFEGGLERAEEELLKEPTLAEVFIDPLTNRVYKRGDIVKREQLAKTLEIIAEEGADALYSKTGSLVRKLVEEINERGGDMSIEDFTEYQ